MAIDHRIYLQQQAPDILGSITRGINTKRSLTELTRLKNAQEEEDRVRQIAKESVVAGPDGSTSLDQKRYLSELTKVNPLRAAQEGSTLRASEHQANLQKLQLHKERASMAAQILAAVKDQPSYERAVSDLVKSGIADPQDFPPVYDPSFVNTMAARTLTVKDQLDQQWKQQEFALKQRDSARKDSELGLKREEMKQKASSTKAAPTEGQKTTDREFAKDYNEWTSGGAELAASEIGKLDAVAKNLKAGKVTTGGLTGAFPDRITSSGVLKARADVQSTIMNSLRAILGAQFTEKEGDRVIKNTWNEADTTENNLARIERLVSDLKAKAAAKESKASYFAEHGTLIGYKPGQSSKQHDGGDTRVYNGVTYKRIGDNWVPQNRVGSE